jgi:hypothetical protein
MDRAFLALPSAAPPPAGTLLFTSVPGLDRREKKDHQGAVG